MNRFFFDQNTNWYFKWLMKEHSQMVRNESLTKYLYKRAIMYTYADHFINSLGMDEDQALDMLLMDKEEQEEYMKLRSSDRKNEQ